MMDMLKANHVYLEANTLGCCTICTIGYLFNLHPTITHKTSLKVNLCAALEQVKLPQAEVIKLDPSAINYNSNNKGTSMPSMRDLTVILLIFPRLPFEFFLTSTGHGGSNNHIATCTLDIKTNVIHGNLLHKLFLCMTNNTTNNLGLKYIPIGTGNIIGDFWMPPLIFASKSNTLISPKCNSLSKKYYCLMNDALTLNLHSRMARFLS